MDITGDRVAANVRELRRRQELSLEELSQRLEDLERPIGMKTLSKLELGGRRVTVDDLVALALVLDVNPNALLLPALPPDDETPLTGAVAAPWWRVWEWATGERPLDDRGQTLSADAAWFDATQPHKDSYDLAADAAARRKASRDRHDDLVDEVRTAQQRRADTRED